MPDKDLLTMKEVQDWLRISRDTLDLLIKRGDIRSTRVGIQRRVYRDSVEAYLARQEEEKK